MHFHVTHFFFKANSSTLVSKHSFAHIKMFYLLVIKFTSETIFQHSQTNLTLKLRKCIML